MSETYRTISFLHIPAGRELRASTMESGGSIFTGMDQICSEIAPDQIDLKNYEDLIG
jgi:hypothetical protein